MLQEGTTGAQVTALQGWAGMQLPGCWAQPCLPSCEKRGLLPASVEQGDRCMCELAAGLAFAVLNAK